MENCGIRSILHGEPGLMTHCRTKTWHKMSCTEYILSHKGGVNNCKQTNF